MAHHPEPSMEDMLRTIAIARLILGPHMNLQAPPNLSYADFPRLLAGGINDWGGISRSPRISSTPKRPGPKSQSCAPKQQLADSRYASALRCIRNS